jgi:hypothetical protein
MMNQTIDKLIRLSPGPQRHFQRVERQSGWHPASNPPPNNPTRVHVDHERGERHPSPRRDVGEIDNPQLVGFRSFELAFNRGLVADQQSCRGGS